MIEAKANIWSYIGIAHVVCITTNGDVNKAGLAVMGRGVAAQAKTRYGAGGREGIAAILGRFLHKNGNHVRPVWTDQGTRIVTFPVKHHWHEKADLELIARSAEQLVAFVNAEKVEAIVLPRPGCGNGGLKWEAVQPVLAPILDDRFLVVTT